MCEAGACHSSTHTHAHTHPDASVAKFLPKNAPLSTFRVMTGSRLGIATSGPKKTKAEPAVRMSVGVGGLGACSYIRGRVPGAGHSFFDFDLLSKSVPQKIVYTRGFELRSNPVSRTASKKLRSTTVPLKPPKNGVN